MNEKCLELKDQVTTKNGKKTYGCEFYRPKAFKNLASHALAMPQDIEEISKRAFKSNTCAYYSMRHAINDAEIIAMPYNVLLHEPTRKASGVKLK
eukprot:Pgem_evm1s5057